VDVVAAPRRASKPAQATRCRAIAAALVSSVLARVAARRLDARLAAGEDLLSQGALARRSRRLVSGPSRRRLARGLGRAWSMPPEPAVLSAAVAVDGRAVDVARSALQQLASALASRADVEPRGVAITQILLTEPSSPLYRPAYPEELYELARAALFALGSREALSAERWRR
jgi:hypothetical protein